MTHITGEGLHCCQIGRLSFCPQNSWMLLQILALDQRTRTWGQSWALQGTDFKHTCVTWRLAWETCLDMYPDCGFAYVSLTYHDYSQLSIFLGTRSLTEIFHLEFFGGNDQRWNVTAIAASIQNLFCNVVAVFNVNTWILISTNYDSSRRKMSVYIIWKAWLLSLENINQSKQTCWIHFLIQTMFSPVKKMDWLNFIIDACLSIRTSILQRRLCNKTSIQV